MAADAQIVTPFVELFYVKELDVKANNAEYLNKALWLEQNVPSENTWKCNTYSSISKNYTLQEDPVFLDLVKECKKEVEVFAKEYGVIDKEAHIRNGWVNVAHKGAYQEYHIHQAAHFSLCYYINTPEDCGSLVFKSHEADKDMFELPVSVVTPPSFKNFSVKPRAGTVVIFRSNLLHMVEVNNSNEPRVGVSMNFELK